MRGYDGEVGCGRPSGGEPEARLPVRRPARYVLACEEGFRWMQEWPFPACRRRTRRSVRAPATSTTWSFRRPPPAGCARSCSWPQGWTPGRSGRGRVVTDTTCERLLRDAASVGQLEFEPADARRWAVPAAGIPVATVVLAADAGRLRVTVSTDRTSLCSSDEAACLAPRLAGRLDGRILTASGRPVVNPLSRHSKQGS